MNFKKKIKKFFELFHSLEISWQIYSLIILYFGVMIAALFMHWQVGLMLFFLLIIVILFFTFNMQNFISNINTLANEISRSTLLAQQDSFYQAPMAIIIYDENKRVRWVNPEMQHIFGSYDLLGQRLLSIDRDFEVLLEIEDDQQWHVVSFRDRYYKVLHRKDNQSFYFIDVSEEVAIREQRKYDQIVFGYLFLDDYNEIIEAMNDQDIAKFDSELLNEINKWNQRYSIYSKRLDEEKFILIFNKKVLDELEESKFRFFDELRERNFTRNVPISISIGISYPLDEAESYDVDELAKQAQLNLDLALGRGGDQIVVRSLEGHARFYGGNTNPTEKRTNIRSRLVYQALVTQVEQADNILISGHRTADTDSIGSAIGMYKISQDLNKNVKIIADVPNFNTDIKKLLSIAKTDYNWDKVFIDEENAKKYVNEHTLIIMVDHHRPSLSEAEAFIDDHDVVIIDHHRRGEDYPETVSLSYIEIYASSTSELITEFFMNTRNNNEGLTSFEATALLSGIIVDTNNFSSRTGSRTFDAASYLKSRGADTAQIQRILKEDLESIVKRNRLLEDMKIIEPGYAIIKGPEDEIIDNIIASQTADMMLDIIGIEASFIIYRRSETSVGISARSLGTINVQTIMERLNGGGHLSNAATQMDDLSVEEVYNELIESIEYDKED